MLLRSVILVTLPLAIHCQPVRIVIDPNPVHMSPPLTVPAEVLRYPLSEHARGMLQKALQLSDRGDHAAAAHQLLRTVAKFPDSAAYVYSLLGVEYLKTSQFSAAVDVLGKSVLLLPHDASNHANLGLALLSEGESDLARPELRRALELDPHYTMANQLLTALAVTPVRLH